MKPMISIVIPVYNGSNYLREAIDSALAQTYENVEVIVVNDGSADGGATEKIARSYGDRIRYFSKENGGVATALNLGIQEMRGEYFSWLSHDDLYKPEKLSEQWEALQSCGDLHRIVYCDYDLLDMADGTVTERQVRVQYPAGKLEDSVFPVLHGMIHGCTLLIHKTHFVRAGRFDETLRTCQDYDLWFRMFRGQKLLFVPQALIYSRSHSEQGTHTIPSFHQEEADFYLKAYMALTSQEVSSIFGHPAFLYRHVEAILNKCKMPEAGQKAAERYRVMQNSAESLRLKAEFCQWFQELCGGTKKICIFCSGQYGKALQKALLDLGISADYFSDSNPQLWGSRIRNCLCVSPEQLRQIQDDTVILVATNTPRPVLEQLQNAGYPHVVSMQALECMD